MCDECNEKEPIRHTQVICDPQPEYPGPEYHGRPDPVHVDAGLHQLLQLLWAKGFQTQFSCEGWLPRTEGGKRYGTKGYILFRTADEALRFWQGSHQRSAAKEEFCPKLILETSMGMSDSFELDQTLPPRGTVRFNSEDLPTLEALWST